MADEMKGELHIAVNENSLWFPLRQITLNEVS